MADNIEQIYVTEAQAQYIVDNILKAQRNVSGGLVGIGADGKIDRSHVPADAAYKGGATPTTVPDTSTGNQWYHATTSGTYTNFGGLTVTAEDGVNILSYSPGSGWSKAVVPIELGGYAKKNEIRDVTRLYFGAEVFTMNGYISANDGTYSSSSTGWATEFLKILPTTDYFFYIGRSQSPWGSAFYDEKMQYLSGFTISTEERNAGGKLIVSPSNARYLRMSGVGTDPSSWYFQSDRNDYSIQKIKKIIESHQPNLKAQSISLNSGESVEDSIMEKDAQIQILQNELVNQFLEIDAITDDKHPLFINTMEFVKGSTVPGEVVTVPISSRNNDYSFTVDPLGISVYENRRYPIVVKDSNDHYSPNRIESVDLSSGQITVSLPLPQSVESFQPMHEGHLGQHLSRFGYRALAERIGTLIERYSYKKNQIYRYDPNECTRNAWNDPKARSINEPTKILADFMLLGGAVNGGNIPGSNLLTNAARTSSNPSNPSPGVLYRKFYEIDQGGAEGKGVSLKISTFGKTGFLQMYVGTDRLQVNSDSPDLSSGFIKVLIEDDAGNEIFTKTVRGALEEINIPFSGYSFMTVKMVTANADITCGRCSGIFVYEKRDDLNENPLKNDHIVGFLGDSWTQYPTRLPEETLPLRWDGSTGNGMQFLSEHLRTHLLQKGVSISTLNQGRGATTSEWGKYWLNDLIINHPKKPDFCVVLFFTNDNNSKSNVANNTPSGYDFDPADPWVFKRSDEGGVFGSVDYVGWINNLKDISERLLRAGIKPIILLPSSTGSYSQTSAHMDMLSLVINGLGK